MSPRAAVFDPDLHATIVSRVALKYRAGPDAALDRPAHLRAGSSLAWLGDTLVLMQDDANFVALVDPVTGVADAITLPAGEGGLRHFDDARGNKMFKLDLEACCVVEGRSGPMLIAFGSGSKHRRRNILTIDGWNGPEPRVCLVDASAFYILLEQEVDFAGSDMNIEGVLALPKSLRLFGRGNGRHRGGLTPLNATCDIPLGALLDYLTNPAGPVPQVSAIEQYELGLLDGLQIGFTDASICGEAVLYTAAAEASKGSTLDGAVSGSVLGVLPATGNLRYARIARQGGRPTREKVEGVVPFPGIADRLFVVVDPDDATRPSELCAVQLTGEWR